MKQFFALLLLSTICLTATAQPRMIVEGRTWWYEFSETSYNAEHGKYYQLTSNIGVSVGPEIEIEGVKWHEINQTLAPAEPGALVQDGFDTESHLIAYAREDKGDVFVMYCTTDNSNAHSLVYDNEITLSQDWSYFAEGGANRQVHLYHFGNKGDRFVIGDESKALYDLTIESEGEELSAGNTYRIFRMADSGDRTFRSEAAQTRCVEGIGYLDDRLGGELFIAPFNSPRASSHADYTPCQLQYVTDAEGEIIYEGIGGRKLWLDYLSVDAIEADGDAASATRWFNLQGVEIDAPSTPGIYIRQNGSATDKVVIR